MRNRKYLYVRYLYVIFICGVKYNWGHHIGEEDASKKPQTATSDLLPKRYKGRYD